MTLDLLLQQLALKHKDFVVLDLSFPHTQVPGFARAQEHRFLAIPFRQNSALALAEGWALSGLKVLLLGFDGVFSVADSTLPVRCVRRDANGDWGRLSASFLQFGSGELLLPFDDFDKL